MVSDATGDGDLYVMDLGTQKLDIVLNHHILRWPLKFMQMAR